MAKKRKSSAVPAQKGPDEARRPTRSLLAAWGALLLCSVLLVYWPALRGGRILDDTGHLTSPDLQSFHGLWRIWFHLGSTPQYYPLAHSAFWIEQKLWGGELLGYHLTNVLLHAVAALLVVAIVRRLGLPGAWLAGFVFALHPVCVETVAWMSEQKTALSAVFYLGAALAYLRFDRTRERPRYWLALGLFLLALMCKTVAATLPAALLVVFWWQRGRLAWKRDLAPLVPWLAIGITAGLFTAWVERKYIGAEGPDFALTLAQRCLLPGRVIWFYLSKLLWPANLSFIYPRWTIDPAAWWQYLFPAAALTLAAGLWLAVRRSRGPLAGFLFFGGTLFPVLGFLNVYPFLYSYVGDHYQYLASLGIIVPVASGLALAAGRIPAAWRRFAPALAGLLLVTLGVLSWRQSSLYQDSVTLYTDTLAHNPDCWMAHNNLGRDLLDLPGRVPEAMIHFREALRLRPNNSMSHHNLGLAYEKLPDRLPEAIAEYQAAIRINPDFTEAHDNLAKAYMTVGRTQDAVAEFGSALRSSPYDARTYNNLGIALAKTGHFLEAIAEFDTALRLTPAYAEAHCNRGNALAQSGRLPEAIAAFDLALRLKPDYVEAHCNRGVALAQSGRLSEAIAAVETAQRIDPSSERARRLLERWRNARQ